MLPFIDFFNHCRVTRRGGSIEWTCSFQERRSAVDAIVDGSQIPGGTSWALVISCISFCYDMLLHEVLTIGWLLIFWPAFYIFLWWFEGFLQHQPRSDMIFVSCSTPQAVRHTCEGVFSSAGRCPSHCTWRRAHLCLCLGTGCGSVGTVRNATRRRECTQYGRWDQVRGVDSDICVCLFQLWIFKMTYWYVLIANPKKSWKYYF